MANYSIPNSTPAIGRISTPLSRQSRKQNNSVARSGPVILRAVESGASRPFNLRRSIQRVGRWMLDRLLAIYRSWAFSFCWRVKGAWWSSRSSKPLSVPHTRDRGRFDSYPLRQISVAASRCRGAYGMAMHGHTALWLQQPQEKEVTKHVA
jgi:hypothetical protein